MQVLTAERCARPSFATGTPTKRVQRAGLSFQRKVGEYLRSIPCGQVAEGPWFLYKNRGKLRYCQPDFLVATPRDIVVIEAKLTWAPNIEEKLLNLYVPVVKKTYAVPVRAVLVCRNLSLGAPPACDLREALESPTSFTLAQEIL